MKIEVRETQFEKRQAADVMRAVKNSFYARNQCSQQQAEGNRPIQAKVFIDDMHVADVAAFSNKQEFCGVPTELFWELWHSEKETLKSLGFSCDKGFDEWTVEKHWIEKEIDNDAPKSTHNCG